LVVAQPGTTVTGTTSVTISKHPSLALDQVVRVVEGVGAAWSDVYDILAS